MPKKSEKRTLLVAWLGVLTLFGCAEITVDEMPTYLDDPNAQPPGNGEKGNEGDGQGTDEVGGTEEKDLEADSSDDSQNETSETETGQGQGDSEESASSPGDPSAIGDEETEPAQDTVPASSDDGGGTDENPPQDDSNDTEAGGGDDAYLCGTEPLLLSLLISVDLAGQILFKTTRQGVGQSFKPVKANIKAIELALAELDVDLGPHTIELIEGDPGELESIALWEVDLPVDNDYFTSVCLPVADIEFDTSKTYSLLVFPNPYTDPNEKFAVLSSVSNTYSAGRAWYTTDRGEIWYDASYDLYFGLY